MIKRGDVVILNFPFIGGGGGKTRPAVVIQCNRLNRILDNVIVAMITGNVKLVGKEPTQFLIDPSTPEGKSSGGKTAVSGAMPEFGSSKLGRRSRRYRPSLGCTDSKAY